MKRSKIPAQLILTKHFNGGNGGLRGKSRRKGGLRGKEEPRKLGLRGNGHRKVGLQGKKAGLGTAFFPVLLKNVPFFTILFLSFWRLIRPKRTERSFPFFSKEWKICKERSVLL